MFQTKTPVAVLAGMAVAGSILMAPGVVAAPTRGDRRGLGFQPTREVGEQQHPRFERAVGGGRLRAA